MERNTACRSAAPAPAAGPPPSPGPGPVPGSRRALPPNAFSRRFLERLAAEDQPATALAAERDGPWTVAPNGHGRWAVFRVGESYAAGDLPAALFDERARALVVAAALPGSAGRGALRLGGRRRPGGYPVSAGGRTVGQLAWFDPDLLAELAALQAVAASPRSLALLLAAAGHDALERAGRILAREVGADG